VHSTHKSAISRWVLAATALSYGFQLVWFGSRCLHQIDIDGIDYIGIARHLRSHQFYSAINDFRSPLLSWMIAAGSFFDGDLVRVGKVLNIGSYLLCGVLLYFFAKSLWHSELTASLAVFWFSLSRGLPVVAVGMVTPDFLFASLTLSYFIVLLQCLRTDERRWWGLLGGIHALAFLAKGFALPWLALSTIFSVLLSRPRKQQAARLALAGILPLLVATAWAGVLHYKYGAFTTGTQFKFNFLQWTPHASSHQLDRTYVLLRNTKPFIDEYNVSDPMPPGSWMWHYRIDARQAAPELVAHEAHNLPKAVKELLIVVTPGGLVAFFFVVAVLVGRRKAKSGRICDGSAGCFGRRQSLAGVLHAGIRWPLSLSDHPACPGHRRGFLCRSGGPGDWHLAKGYSGLDCAGDISFSNILLFSFPHGSPRFSDLMLPGRPELASTPRFHGCKRGFGTLPGTWSWVGGRI